MIGASGAVSGVLGAYMLLFPHAVVRVLLILGFFVTIAHVPALMALGASVRLVSASGEREVAVEDLYADDGIRYLTRRPDEILTEGRRVLENESAAVAAMFSGVGRVLHPGAQFLLYGPFNYDGQFTSPSNRDFDARLRAYDPAMGVRDVAWLTELATASAMALAEDIEMPVNNRLLIWQKA